MSKVEYIDIRGCAMKVGKRKTFVEENSAQNDRARSEWQSFMRAVRSYPEQFERDPRITFEKYYENLIETKRK